MDWQDYFKRFYRTLIIIASTALSPETLSRFSPRALRSLRWEKQSEEPHR